MTQQIKALPDTDQISQEGQKILETLVPRLGKEQHGRFIAIDVHSRDYFLGKTAIEATRKAQARHPDKIFFLGRVGYRTAYTFKGRR